MRPSDEAFISDKQLRSRIAELATKIDFEGRKPIVITVLEGARTFAVALTRHLGNNFESGSIRAKSYAGTESSGSVNVTLIDCPPLEGREILLIEDIVDTGRTAKAIFNHLTTQNPASIRMVSLLDKPSRRVVNFEADWVGFTIEDHFVVGFGLDYDEAYRDLPDIRILEPEAGSDV